MATIETARLMLRRLQAADMDTYYERIYADPDVMRTLPAQRPISREEFDTRIPTFMIDHWTQHGFGPWAVIYKDNNQFLGHCGLRYWPDSTDVEVFYAFAKPYWGTAWRRKAQAPVSATASSNSGSKPLSRR